MTIPRTVSAHLVEAPGGRLLVALWGGLALVDLSRACNAPATAQLTLLLGLAVACSAGQSVGAALAVAGTVWLVVTGFVVNTYGELRLGGAGDVLRLLLVAAVAVAAAGLRR